MKNNILYNKYQAKIQNKKNRKWFSKMGKDSRNKYVTKPATKGETISVETDITTSKSSCSIFSFFAIDKKTPPKANRIIMIMNKPPIKSPEARIYRKITPAVTGAFVVSAANEKCVRVYGLVMLDTHTSFPN